MLTQGGRWSRRGALSAIGVCLFVLFSAGLAVAATFTGTAGNDTEHGTPNDDSFAMFGGDDRAFGEEAGDYLGMGSGQDGAKGGHGQDEIEGVDGADDRLITGNHGLLGGDGNDIIQGGNANDLLRGGNNHDVLRGADGPVDEIDGADGSHIYNDEIYGGDGGDDICHVDYSYNGGYIIDQVDTLSCEHIIAHLVYGDPT